MLVFFKMENVNLGKCIIFIVKMFINIFLLNNKLVVWIYGFFIFVLIIWLFLDFFRMIFIDEYKFGKYFFLEF